MERGYSERRTEADKYIPRQLRIIAFIWKDDSNCRLATVPEDWSGIDVWVGDCRTALRVRFPPNHYNDVAIRDIELRKLIHGETKYMLYCQATDHAQTDRITGWKLIDLDALRRASETWYDGVHWDVRTAANGDRFHTFDLDDLESKYGPAVVASGSTVNTITRTTDQSGNTVTTTTTTTVERFNPVAMLR